MNKEHSYSKNIKNQKEILSQKIKDWKEDNYKPWMEHSFKPWKKQAIKDLKRGKKRLMKKIELWKKEITRRYIKWRKNRAKYHKALNINIKNIEKVEFGNKEITHHNYIRNISSDGQNLDYKFPQYQENRHIPLRREYDRIEFHNNNNRISNYPSPRIQEGKYLEFNNINEKQAIIDFDEIFVRFNHLQKLLRTYNYRQIIIESQELIDIFIKNISQFIGINYMSVNQFLTQLIRMNLDKKFIFYNEIVDYNTFLQKYNYNFNQMTAHTIILIVERIINKLEQIKNKNRDNDFSEMCNEIYF